MKKSLQSLQSLKPFKRPLPAGVRLPSITIDKKYYDELNLDPSVSNLEFLKVKCEIALAKYFKELSKGKVVLLIDYEKRLYMELDVLKDLGFIDYVLLNWDVINFCHENDIPTGPGRGSAAGSLVLFLLRVTNVDPIEYGLFFERFVSKSRAKKTIVDGTTYLDGSLLCDVDNDISYDRRQEVIKYIEEKHKGKTCKILTLNTLTSKLCIKECHKIVNEGSEEEANQISSFIPKAFGKVFKLEKAYAESAKFSDYLDKNKKVFDIARKLEGLPKNTGVHPSGIAISFYKLDEVLPTQQTNDGHIISAYDMNDVADLMVKFDILGLRTLTVVNDCCKTIGISPESVQRYVTNENSIETYSHFHDLRSPKGLFQVEADTNFKVAKEVSPKSLEDLSAVIAIARPGALDYLSVYAEYTKTGEFQSVNSFFDDILSYTGGIPLYQEQLMQMAVKVGFTLDESEQLRRIVGKKKVEEMPAWKAKIESKIKDFNLDPSIGETLWKVAEDSANYSFNKSHSISYAILSAMTTYLKFNHPKEFFLSLLKMTKHEPDSREEISLISQELHQFGIKLLPPDLGLSDVDFSIEGDNIRYGITAIKGISEKTLVNMLDFRNAQPTTTKVNTYDIFLAAKQSGLNIGVLSGLIQGGMMDSFCWRTSEANSSDEQKIPDRCRLVLEAQTFNILTDREKRNFIQIGDKSQYDILSAIHEARTTNLVGDDGRPIFKDSRWKTFIKKYEGYKTIYAKNKKHIKFANWFFEKRYLGYSHSLNISDIFYSDNLSTSFEIKDTAERTNVKFVGEVVDAVSRISGNGNRYIRMELHDDFGKVFVMLMDNRRKQSLTKYKENGGKTPKKGEIVYIYGSVGQDIIFADYINILDQKIYTKLSEL
jgi:DNA-directed DNA polymerase III PolC